jgi:hypothetical protein
MDFIWKFRWFLGCEATPINKQVVFQHPNIDPRHAGMAAVV